MPIDPSRAMDRIEGRLRQLQIEYRRFFNGALEIPPMELTEALQADFRALRAGSRLTVADSYRLGALEARFTSYAQLHHRRLQGQEIQVAGRSRKPPVPNPDSEPRTSRRRQPDASAVLVGRDTGPGAFNPLYEQIYRTGGDGRPKVSRQQFVSYLADQVERIREKTGCTQVQVQVVSEDGRRRLRVKGLRSGTTNTSDAGSDNL